MLFLRLFNILRWVFIWLSVSSQRVPEMSSEFSFAAKTKHWSLMDFPFAPRMKESRGMREPPAGGTQPQAAPALRDEQATHRRAELGRRARAQRARVPQRGGRSTAARTSSLVLVRVRP